jgi:hypothetical protein
MQPDRTRCTECGGTMEPGYLLDFAHGAVRVPTWVGGTPTKRWWGALKINWDSQRQIVTNRCISCGFLKSYAASLALKRR